jgi:hypothetical protein
MSHESATLFASPVPNPLQRFARSAGAGLAFLAGMPDASFQYAPRDPEATVLYQVVAQELETFLRRQEERDRPVPRFVEEEFRSFLGCGVWARGFLRLRCQKCGHDRLLPFSCKRRGICSSCGGRRMADTAAHLVDRVIPIVPVRQWVLSMPFPLRYRMAYDAALLTDVLTVFIRALFGELQRRARQLLDIRSSQCGAVTFVQRCGDALNANPHFHCLVLDGVYAAGANGQPEFHQLPAPENEDVLRLAELAAQRVESLLKRRGLGPEAETAEADPLSGTDPGMASLLANSVRRKIAAGSNTGRSVVRLGDQFDGDSLNLYESPRCASVAGFSVHANVAIEARDRHRLEQLIRYAARPAIATERLSELPDGRLLYRLKRPWRDGTNAVIFERQDFIAKLAVLVPAPRAHLTRYHGILGPCAAWRSLIVPLPQQPPPSAAAAATTNNNPETGVTGPSQPPPQTSAPEIDASAPTPAKPHPRNYTWCELMKRVFLLDVLQCEICGGAMKIIAAIHAPDTTRKILECLGLPSRGPPLAAAVSDFTAHHSF